MQQVEGFQYAIALDLNTGYYTIRLSLASQYMTTIVTEFGKFRYDCFPMGMYTSRDIFQAKVYKIIGYINNVKTYIYDILVLGKDSFEKHIEQLKIIFVRLRAAGLKVNGHK